MRALKAGVVYFLLVFAVGWILGPTRELWAVPHFGRMAAMLSEAVIMMIAMIVAARWVIRRLDIPQTLGATIPMGLVAIGLLVPNDRGRPVRARAVPPRVRWELCYRRWRHLTAHVLVVCRYANPGGAVHT
jgi:hypothetical protein